MIGDLSLPGLGYEAHIATLRDMERLAGARSQLVATTDVVEKLRATKTPEEIAAIRVAALLADEALDEVLPRIRVGQSEYEVAAELEASLRRRESEWHPFPTIVASGPRSALPHARTSRRVLGAGDWLLLDFGAQVDGYCADLTRTVVVGARADDRQRTVYDIVRRGPGAGDPPGPGRDAGARVRPAGPGFHRRARIRRRVWPFPGPWDGAGSA